MPSPSYESKKAEARKKGTIAAVATAASVATIAVASPVLGVAGLAGSAFLGYRWIKFRIKEGIRF